MPYPESKAPEAAPNPWGRSPETLFGFRLIVTPDRPRYELPAEILPGLPWPEGFREEINAWARGFFRPVNMLQDGAAVVMTSPSDAVMMNPRTLAAMRLEAEALGVSFGGAQ